MRLLLVRHGETEWNIQEVFRGTVDIPLNDNGISQASLLAAYLRRYKLEAVYSSPLQRALKTAGVVAESQDNVLRVVAGLRDMHFGEWEGMPLVEVKDKYPDVFHQWANRPDKARIPGAENLGIVRRRGMGVIKEVTARHTGDVLLVTHRVVIKVLVCALLGLPNSHFWNIRQDTCGLTTFIYEKGLFILAEHNNTSFLDRQRAEIRNIV